MPSPFKPYTPSNYNSLVQLHIAEYTALTTRGTYWITLQKSLIPASFLLLTLFAQLWTIIPDHAALIWLAVIALEALCLLWYELLGELYKVILYIETNVKGPLTSIVLSTGFWNYEADLAKQREAKPVWWEWLYAVCVWLALMGIVFLRRFQEPVDGVGLSAAILLACVISWRALTAVRLRRSFFSATVPTESGNRRRFWHATVKIFGRSALLRSKAAVAGPSETAAAPSPAIQPSQSVNVSTPISRGFATKISTFNTLGLALGIGFTSFLDPQLTTHVRYHARSYQWGWFFIPVVLVGALTYPAMRQARGRGWYSVLSFGPLAIIGFFCSFWFPPESPHMGVLSFVVGYCLLSFVTTWLRLCRPEAGYINEEGVPLAIRLERLKATITLWQTIAMSGTMGYIALVIAWIAFVWKLTSYIVTNAAEQFLLGQAFFAEVAIFSLLVIIGPLAEAFGAVRASIAQLTEIRPRGGKVPQRLKDPRFQEGLPVADGKTASEIHVGHDRNANAGSTGGGATSGGAGAAAPSAAGVGKPAPAPEDARGVRTSKKVDVTADQGKATAEADDQDTEVPGKVKQFDPSRRILVITMVNGKDRSFLLPKDVDVLVKGAKSRRGLNEPAIRSGAAVEVVTDEGGHKVKELKIVSAKR